MSKQKIDENVLKKKLREYLGVYLKDERPVTLKTHSSNKKIDTLQVKIQSINKKNENETLRKTCLLCRKPATKGILLSNGELVHKNCVDEIENNLNNEIYNINKHLAHIHNINEEIRNREKFGYKIKTFFIGEEHSTAELEKKIQQIKSIVNDLQKKANNYRIQLTSIYDYYLSYPPDWHMRKSEVITRDGEICCECNSSNNLHLHHLTPLNKGGTNKLENLVLLCENCHSGYHGGRNLNKGFKDYKNSSRSIFEKRLQKINFALDNNKKIKFKYKKYDDNHYTRRIVHPKSLINIKHTSNEGTTLCVRGYCELRKEERTFAIKRMTEIKVL